MFTDNVLTDLNNKLKSNEYSGSNKELRKLLDKAEFLSDFELQFENKIYKGESEREKIFRESFINFIKKSLEKYEYAKITKSRLLISSIIFYNKPKSNGASFDIVLRAEDCHQSGFLSETKFRFSFCFNKNKENIKYYELDLSNGTFEKEVYE